MDEIIDLGSDQFFMGEALRQARRAYEADEVPIGCVILHEGKTIARAHTQVDTLRPASAHAEMLAITQAESVLENCRLNECQLYGTKEPCPMCAGAMVHVRLQRVIFGCTSTKDGAGGSLLNILQHPQLNHRCEITNGVRGDECSGLLRSFFLDKRSASSKAEDA